MTLFSILYARITFLLNNVYGACLSCFRATDFMFLLSVFEEAQNLRLYNILIPMEFTLEHCGTLKHRVVVITFMCLS